MTTPNKNTSQKKILVVDDEAYLREIILFDLRTFGHQMIEAESGLQALRLLKTESIDLVISDVRMPDGTGIDLLERMQTLYKVPPSFVFMTAYCDISSEEALDLGAEAFLRKPLEKSELLEVVERALIPRSERWTSKSIDYRGVSTINISSLGLLPHEHEPIHIQFGQGGMFVSMERNFPSVFEVVHFKIGQDHDFAGFEGYGQIRWVRPIAVDGLPAGVGLEFLQLDDISNQFLQDHLVKYCPCAFIPIGKIETSGT